MKTDRNLEKDVQDAFKWDPLLKHVALTVNVHEGLVTLTGEVQSYQEKLHAESIAKSINGVKSILDHITVKAVLENETTDHEIEKNVLKCLRLKWIPIDRIKVKAEEGHVTLNGEVTYNFQKEDAKKCVGSVKGVTVFTNNLELVSETKDNVEKRIIEHALLRYAATANQNIRVKVAGNTIDLNGTVESLYQKEEAEKIAWNAPGVLAVNNELVVE